MVKSTGEPLLDSNGNPIVATKEFTPTDAKGFEKLTFTFDGSLLAGETIVVFESLEYYDFELVVHADINDEAQSIYFAKIGTTASDKEDGDKQVRANNTVTIVDKVEYTNLIVGESYTIKGVLMDKSTGKPFFEKLYLKEKEVVSHEDINDINQTIKIIPNQPGVKTGDSTNIQVYTIVGLSSLICMIIFILIKKRQAKELK